MERVGHDEATPAVEGKSKVPHAGTRPRTALILYGSETGNAQDVAEEIGRMAERLRFDTTVLDMDAVQLRDVLKPTVVMFALSTTGQGEMPQNARRFWKTLLSGALKPGTLRRVRFASFGLGDSSYARFNVAHRMLCGRMRQLGAQEFCERGEGNEQHPEGHSAGFREWTVGLRKKVLEVFPLGEDVEPIPDDQFLEPRWKLEVLHQVDAPASPALNGCVPSSNGGLADGVGNGFNNGLENGLEDGIDNGYERPSNGTPQTANDIADLQIKSSAPSPALLPIEGAHVAHIQANERITAPDHFQDVRLVDLRLNDTITYNPGAIAVVYPKNFPSDIQDFIDLMGWQSVADQPLTLTPTTTSPQSPNNPTLSPLRHLQLSNITLTLRWLLENILDIMSIPRRSFFSSLSHFARTKTEDSAYQRDRLLELANPELIDELWDYTTRPKRTIVEVMMDFTTVKIPWQYALSVLPVMKGRQFSIASGGHLRRDEEGRTRVQLLVAIADPPSPIIKYRRRYGVCTRYIASLQPDQSINIGTQEGYLDPQPVDLAVPAIMIGPGTGLAPMRSLIWQRLHWSQNPNLYTPGKKGLEHDILIFGSRNEEGDHFFRSEWSHLQHTENLTVLTAFSRDKDKPRQYVQDQIRAHADLIRRAIVEKKGKVYVCGSSGNMPKGVREALVDVLVVKEEEAMNREVAEGYLDRMEKEGRYKQETW